MALRIHRHAQTHILCVTWRKREDMHANNLMHTLDMNICAHGYSALCLGCSLFLPLLLPPPHLCRCPSPHRLLHSATPHNNRVPAVCFASNILAACVCFCLCARCVKRIRTILYVLRQLYYVVGKMCCNAQVEVNGNKWIERVCISLCEHGELVCSATI